MTISVPTAEDKIVLLDTSVVDPTTSYDPTIRAYYQTDQKMQNLDNIYSFSGASFIPDLYDAANEQTYIVNKVLFKDATTVKVTAVGNVTVLKQPEEYTAVADTTFTFNTWTKPFSKIQTLIPAGTYNGFTKVVDGVTHQLYRDSTSSTGWRYKITYSKLVTEGPLYHSSTPRTYWKSTPLGSTSTIYWDGVEKGTTGQNDTSMVASDGNTYYRGNLYFYDQATGSSYYYISRTVMTSFTYNTEARVYTSLDGTSVISSAYCADTADCADRWLGRTFVLRGSDLYVRTNSGVIETKVVNIPQYAVINDLTEFPNFAFIGKNDSYKPFDNKNYTEAIAQGSMMYEIRVDEPFDTIALGNVKAEYITLTFYDELDNVVATAIGDIDTSRDTIGNLDSWYTTLIIYSSPTGKVEDAIKINAGGRVVVTLTSSTGIALSTLLPAVSAQAGMTNMEINNEYKDFSTFGYDAFGNPDYVERARVSRYSGNVDIPITDYAKTDRLMSSLGKRMVVVNGANMSSLSADSQSMFASTQKIGRFMSFKQNTKIKDDDLDVVANYSFLLEEII